MASAALSVTVSDVTLRHVFPHLLETEGRTAALGMKLLGQRLLLPHTTIFEWDGECSRIEQLTMSVDFLSPVLQLLGSLEDAAIVLDKAFIAPEA